MKLPELCGYEGKYALYAGGFSVRLFLLCCIPLVADAFSVNDIPQTDDNRIKQLVHEVSEREKFCVQWREDWPWQVPRDSVSEHLHTVVHRANEIQRQSRYQYQLTMLKAVAWHHLYQLEVDSAFEQGQECILDAARIDPAATEAAWLKGVHLIKGSFLSTGFSILDSLRTRATFDRSAFLLDYAKLSALCFLPPEHRHMDTTFTLDSVNPRYLSIYIPHQEQLPVCEQWSVFSTADNNHRQAGYSFMAEFSLGREFSLSFPGLKSARDIAFKMHIPRDVASSVPESIVEDPFARNQTARISVQLEPLADAPALWDYMKAVAIDGFDIVERKNDLEHLGAVSLRCKVKSPFSNVTDRTYAVIAFDHEQTGQASRFYKSPSIELPVETIAYRYRIVMECRGAVANKAERLLQEVIGKFAKL